MSRVLPQLRSGIINKRNKKFYIAVGFASLVIGLVFDKIYLIEGSLLLIPLIVVYPEQGGKQPGASLKGKRIIKIGEAITLLGALLVELFFTYGYNRPIPFFVLIIGFYLFLLAETTLKSASVGNFVVKWFIAQAILYGSFASLYPGFVAVDSYRDANIAAYILSTGGGIPHFFTNVAWYNFSPIAPLVYGVTSLLAGLPIVTSELVSGFLASVVLTLVIAALVYFVSKSPRYCLTAIWIGGVIPYTWTWATWPIPETFAVAFAVTVLLVSFHSQSNSLILIAIVTIATVLTHGAIALLLAGALLSMYVISRQPRLFKILLLLCVVYITYLVFVSVANTTNGLLEVWTFLSRVLTPHSVLFVPNINGGSINSITVQLLEAVTGTYWYLLIMVLSIAGFDRFLKMTKNFRRQEVGLVAYLVIVLAVTVVFSITGSRTDALRYIGLMGYALSSVTLTIGLIYLLDASKYARVFAVTSLVILATSSVAYGVNSPDLWQDLGQNQFALSQRLAYSITGPELSSQVFLNHFDMSQLVIANYYPERVNLSISAGDNGIGLGEYGMNGVNVGSKPATPYVILLSERFDSVSDRGANPAAEEYVQLPNVVYSSSISTIIFLG
jgi:hypothetical protein